MKRHLGIIASFIMLFALAAGWSGCSNNGGFNACCPEVCAPASCDPVVTRGPCAQPCAQPCVQPCAAPCAAPAQQCCYGNSGQIGCEGVSVTATQPKLCILGDNYALDVTVHANLDVCHVEVNAMLPEGVSLVRSEPAGVEENNGVLTWKFNAMKKGECHKSRVILRADREGQICVCFCVTAIPVQFCAALCARPILECSKCGPEQVCPGEPVRYTITVSNTGSCAAEDVVVVDNVPDGLDHSSGQRRLCWDLGTLAPCQTKKIDVCFTACKRGTVCNTVNVTSCNAHPTSCQACTCICCCLVELTKTGPKEKKVGENADYTITVSNPGDLPLTGVVLCDQAPSATSIVEAPGAVVNGNQAVWRFDELKPGDQKSVNLTLTTCTPGYFVNRVSVDNCQRCRDCAEFGTRWRGSPALNGCFQDSKDPICVGDFNSYTVRVTNQGTEEDTNLKLVVRFPENLTPVTTHGDANATISGNTVTFDPIQVAGSRQSFNFRVDAQAKSKGDARIKAEISSDTIRQPITLEESTIIN